MPNGSRSSVRSRKVITAFGSSGFAVFTNSGSMSGTDRHVATSAFAIALASVLARMGDPALERVARLAVDGTLAPAARIGPISSLGAFHDRRAASTLITILAGRMVDVPPPPRLMPEPVEVRAAACAALNRLTGLNLGSDAAPWLTWWAEASQLPPEQWLRTMAQSLAELVRQGRVRMEEAERAASDPNEMRSLIRAA